MNIRNILKILCWLFLPFIMVYKEVSKNHSTGKSIIMAGAVLLWWLFAMGNSNSSDSTKLQTKIDSKNTKIDELESDLSSMSNKLDSVENKLFNEKQTNYNSKEKQTAATEPATQVPTNPPTPVPTAVPKEFTFSSGNFVAGKDFPGGTYDIVAVSGGGNVSSDNMYSGGINAIIGVQNDDMYEKEYKNIKLPKGTVLKISRVTIKLIKK